MPYSKPGDPYAPPGWKPPKKPPKVPPVGKGIGDIGSWLKGAGAKLQPRGIGIGKGASMLPMLGKALPWVGAALTGYQTYNLAKQPMANLFGIGDYYTDYQNYLDAGGNLSYNQWAASGKPGKGVKVRTAADVAAKPLVTPETPEERIRRTAIEAQAEADRIEAGRREQAWATPIPGEAKLGELVTVGGQLGFWKRDEDGYPDFIPVGNAQEIQTQKDIAKANRDWWREQATMEAEQEKQRQLTNLRANPASWLEYSLLAGQTPGIQPWMQPLMPQQYAAFGAGQAIPGYNPTGQGLGLPELTPPSRQYQARMGPTAQQQFYGYEQARTGARPEETQFRLWSQAPPGGRNRSLSWMR